MFSQYPSYEVEKSIRENARREREQRQRRERDPRHDTRRDRNSKGDL